MIAPLMLVAAAIASSPSLGVAEGHCRPGETGPAIIVRADGLLDRRGELKLELYPADDRDFLADDNILLMAGKTFRRVYAPLPAAGPVQLCIRVPAPGAYSLLLLHDRNSDHRFTFSSDGVGFPGNPRLGLGRPHAAEARIVAGAGLTHADIILNYRRGILFRPLSR